MVSNDPRYDALKRPLVQHVESVVVIVTVTHAGSLIALGSEKPTKLKVPGSTAGTTLAGEHALALPVWSLPFCVSTLGAGTMRPVTWSNGAASAAGAAPSMSA